MQTTLSETPIEIPVSPFSKMMVTVEGMTALICNRFSERVKDEIEFDQTGGPKRKKKEPRNPEQEFIESLYRLPDGRYGFPVVAFKKAMVRACSTSEINATMTDIRQAVHISSPEGDELVSLTCSEPEMRTDRVRHGGQSKTTNLRYRPQFREWSATLIIRFNRSYLTRDKCLALLQEAGIGVGIGNWRPECNGWAGTFSIREVMMID